MVQSSLLKLQFQSLSWEKDIYRYSALLSASKPETLEQLSRQNELILNSVGEGLCCLDLGRITFVNPAAAEIA